MADNEKNSSKEEDALHDKMREHLYEKSIKNHNLMLKGLAEGLIIETNSAKGLSPYDSNSQEKKKEKEHEFYRHLLNEMLNGLREGLLKVKHVIEAGQKLRELFKKGKLDFNNPTHIDLLNEYGISRSEIEADGIEAFNRRDEELLEEKEDYERKIQKVELLQSSLEQNPDDPSIQYQISDFVDENPYFLGSFDTNTLNEVTNQEFKEIKPEFGSFSKILDSKGGINAKNISTTFNNESLVENNALKPPKLDEEDTIEYKVKQSSLSP